MSRKSPSATKEPPAAQASFRAHDALKLVTHLFLGESRLRQAIKQTVANGGHKTVLLDLFERIALKFGELMIGDDKAPAT